jgi:hypothetical protein
MGSCDSGWVEGQVEGQAEGGSEGGAERRVEGGMVGKKVLKEGKVSESGGDSEEDLAGFETGLEANRTCAGEQEVQGEGLVQR